MSFSKDYSDIFLHTYTSLEKKGHMHKIALLGFGPWAKQTKKLQSRIDDLGLKVTPQELLKDRKISHRLRSGTMGYGNTDRIVNEHMSRRINRASDANPAGLAPSGFGAKGMVGAGALGVAGVAGADHYASNPGESMVTRAGIFPSREDPRQAQMQQQMQQRQMQQQMMMQRRRQMMAQRQQGGRYYG